MENSVILIASVVIFIKVVHSSCSISVFKLLIKQLQVPLVTQHTLQKAMLKYQILPLLFKGKRDFERDGEQLATPKGLTSLTARTKHASYTRKS